jgi:UDP-glucose:(heptosyl)LPS alpha-1,3-glucosyltransferase
MKIALAHKKLDFAGGTERDFYRTAEGLRDLDHEVHLFCAEFGVPPPEGTQVHKLPSFRLGRTARLLSSAFLSPKVIRSHQCDVVVGFGRMVRQDILRSGGGSHKVFLQKMEQEGGFSRRLWHRVSLYHRSVVAIERIQYRPSNFKKVLAVSTEVKREIMATYQVPEEKISVIYNGVDPERFHPRNRAMAREKIRKRWDIPGDARLVLFVGAGFQRKGLDRLLKAWELLRLAEVYLLVVGGDAHQRQYVSLAKKHANGTIRFAGRQEDVASYYGAADLLALPARQEAFGNVVLEALASGLPVLISEVVGATEVLSGPLKQGILKSPDDPSEIKDRILSLLDFSRWSLMSEEARRLGEKYSWKSHFRQLEAHLSEVMEEARHGSVS